jgi:hypothetical protein
MAKLQDLKYDGEYVFCDEMRKFLEQCDERSVHYWPIIKAAEQLTDDELFWFWIDAIGAFETSHKDYESPPKELVEKAGPLAHFFTGYGAALCDLEQGN